MKYNVELLKSIVDERITSFGRIDKARCAASLTGESKIYSFQISTFCEECAKYILQCYPNIMFMKGEVELAMIKNHVMRNAKEDLAALDLGLPNSYLDTIKPIYQQQ